MTAITTATEHVVATLRASAEVRALLPNLIQEGVADERAVMPYVLVQPYGDGEDLLLNGEDRAFTTVMLSVRVVNRSLSVGTLRPLAAAVEKALNATWGEYEGDDGGTSWVTSCHRVNETSLAEIAAGGVVRYLGGIYELVVS